MKIESNAEAIQRFMEAGGLEEVTTFRFELPSGLTITVDSEDDPFLNEPYQEGTQIKPFSSADAGATIPLSGDRWRIHQSDPDNWPSDFHAHNLVRHEETLECRSGEIYDRRTKRFIRKYRSKELAAFHALVPDRLKRS